MLRMQSNRKLSFTLTNKLKREPSCRQPQHKGAAAGLCVSLSPAEIHSCMAGNLAWQGQDMISTLAEGVDAVMILT